MSIPENLNCCAVIRPEPFIRSLPTDILHKQDESRLERFLDKADANDDGKLSRKELSEAADTNDNGFVSQSEKAEMKAKLLEYMKDDNAIKRLDSETLGKAQQMLEFLDNPQSGQPPSSIGDTLKDMFKYLDKPLSPPIKQPFFLPDAPGRQLVPPEYFDRIETPEAKHRV